MNKPVNTSKWGGAKARERYATGGGVKVGYRGTTRDSHDFDNSDNTTKTTTRFLPKYDFDYDPTGGNKTGTMTGFGQSDEISSVKSKMDKSLGDE